MYPTKNNTKANFPSPDLSKMKAVIIDHRTTIYIAQGADSDEARERYLARYQTRLTK